ncbi:DUF5919 domain-containing protein [Amycolatopsis sp. WQ 127309]|uniref:DUF5919 domain-containing protein n=1 Tax=Amycolatopsis sp. WQ 127309 TaxID=2932773 RepID=UPI001FF39B8A|nr:DUF5919 domain-containing protein [Amycolatopsis sp. WQ 127309]UOZ07498.1 DUF5919 domain-containing protein [Amycolatopsis sp. WQ 127309]
MTEIEGAGSAVVEHSNVLKVLLRQRHLQNHRMFCREYNKLAKAIDHDLVDSFPKKAQFYRWLAGDIIGLPYPHHCRILESMFPGWTVEQLFQKHSGGIGFVPEPPVTKSPILIAETANQVASVRDGVADVTAVFETRPQFAHEMPPHELFDDAENISMVGLSLNMLCQQYSDRALKELLERGTIVKCLFLDPDGYNIKSREREESHPDGVLITLTKLNIDALRRLRTKLSDDACANLHIRTYDEAVRFNITVIDNTLCIVQPYLPDARGVESPTLVLERQDEHPSGLFHTFSSVFETMWERGSDVLK